MLTRRPIVPNVIEINFQAGHLLGCNVYLVFDDSEWILIDIGYEETVDEILELVRQLDFPLAKCKMILTTHADVDHAQGLAAAKRRLRTRIGAHPKAADLLRRGDALQTFAEIEPQGIRLAMPPVEVDIELSEGDTIDVGRMRLDVWHAPGHTDHQLAFRLDNVLFCADAIFRDGCVGAIDAHHGSNLVDCAATLRRIRDSDVEWLLPSHGPIFRKDPELLGATIGRIEQYQHMADFGTCAVDWPLIDEWEREIAEGRLPP
ncbi:MAG: MBL fold metallo-hydrolase [Planctomycetes bacterium]|nr:MBL fold metallo-hydrolase [Planctomycetota bacterium]